MSLPLPHATEPVVGDGGQLSRGWYEFLSRVTQRLGGPVQLPSYTVATLPQRAPDGWAVFASDAGGGGVPVYSRGGQWLRFDTNVEVA